MAGGRRRPFCYLRSIEAAWPGKKGGVCHTMVSSMSCTFRVSGSKGISLKGARPARLPELLSSPAAQHVSETACNGLPQVSAANAEE